MSGFFVKIWTGNFLLSVRFLSSGARPMINHQTPLKIDKYQFGKIIVDGATFRHDVIIFPNHVSPDWWREEGHSLCIADLQEVVEEHPDLLIVGTGAYGRLQVDDAVKKQIREKGIDLEIFPTEQACARYNQSRRQCTVAAALHLSC